MMTRILLVPAFALVLSLSAWVSSARAQPVEILIGAAPFLTLEDAVDALGTATYLTIDPTYSEFDEATFFFTLGHQIVSINYDSSDFALIELIDESTGSLLAVFAEMTRAESEVLLMDFLLLLFETQSAALQLLVGNTATDPVAGNPVSLQTTMANAAFAAGSDVGPSPFAGGSRVRGTLAYNHLGLALESGKYTGPGFRASIQSLPISYTIPFDDPRWALNISAPLAFTVINGTRVLAGSVGVGVRIPIYDHWTLTPEVRIGYTQNKILNVNAMLFQASITSNFKQALRNGYDLVFGNAVIYSRSLSTGGVNYGLENIILKNGAEISGPMKRKLYGLPTNWQLPLVHSKINGTPSYVDQWVDLSLSVGTVGSKNGVTWDSVRIGLTYTHANNGIRGLNLNFGYEF